MGEAMLFFRAYRDALSFLPEKDQLETLWAMLDYGLDGKEPEGLSPVARAVFTVARPSIASSSARREEGRKGGRPRKKPLVSENAKPLVSENAKPLVSENAKPTVSENAKPMVSENAKPMVSGNAKPTVSENTKPMVSENAKPKVSENAKPMVSGKSEKSETMPSHDKDIDRDRDIDRDNDRDRDGDEDEESGRAAAPPARARFVPPRVEELRAYAAEKGLDLDPEQFLDYYASKGWLVGKSPMKDWRAAARSWARRERASPRPERGFRHVSRDEEYEGGWL